MYLPKKQFNLLIITISIYLKRKQPTKKTGKKIDRERRPSVNVHFFGLMDERMSLDNDSCTAVCALYLMTCGQDPFSAHIKCSFCMSHWGQLYVEFTCTVMH